MLIFQGDKKNTGSLNSLPLQWDFCSSFHRLKDWPSKCFIVLSTNDCLAAVFMNNYRVVIWKFEKALMENEVTNILLFEINPLIQSFNCICIFNLQNIWKQEMQVFQRNAHWNVQNISLAFCPQKFLHLQRLKVNTCTLWMQKLYWISL